mmetsp:Transcript_20648/g.59981  ORF Transcript_20648/g.59981 Transcript_20648/m.59981 type:complete len:200 (+) Transcript_20648:635-1234(+)
MPPMLIILASASFGRNCARTSFNTETIACNSSPPVGMSLMFRPLRVISASNFTSTTPFSGVAVGDIVLGAEVGEAVGADVTSPPDDGNAVGVAVVVGMPTGEEVGSENEAVSLVGFIVIGDNVGDIVSGVDDGAELLKILKSSSSSSSSSLPGTSTAHSGARHDLPLSELICESIRQRWSTAFSLSSLSPSSSSLSPLP